MMWLLQLGCWVVVHAYFFWSKVCCNDDVHGHCDVCCVAFFHAFIFGDASDGEGIVQYVFKTGVFELILNPARRSFLLVMFLCLRPGHLNKIKIYKEMMGIIGIGIGIDINIGIDHIHKQ